MIGRTLALANRSLRSDARSAVAHLLRGGLAAGMLACLVLQDAVSLRSSAAGLFLFNMISALNFFVILLVGGASFASTLTEEKEEQTLGLLKLAGISPLSLLLGKWLPRVWTGSLLLLIQLPFAFLAVTLGGVLWTQILAAYAVLLSFLILSGGTGLLFSLLVRTTGVASGLTIGVLLGISLGAPIISETPELDSFTQIPSVNGWLELGKALSTPLALNEIARPGTGNQNPSLAIALNLILGAGLLGLATVLFTPCTHHEGPAASWLAEMRRLSGRYGRLRSRRAWSWALTGKDFQQVAFGPLGLIVRAVLIALSALLAAFVDSSQLWRVSQEEWGEIVFFISLVFFVFDLGILSIQTFRGETSHGTWSTLCTLPKSISELAYPKLLGSFQGLIPSIVGLVTGLVIWPQLSWELARNITRGDDETALLVFTLAMSLVAIHVAVWISISFRWGVLPVALAVGALVPVITVALIVNFLRPTDLVILFLYSQCVVAVLLMPIGHVIIGRKLKMLAGQ